MDNSQNKDPYNFDKTKEGLEKRFRVIISERNAYKLKEKRKKSSKQQVIYSKDLFIKAD